MRLLNDTLRLLNRVGIGRASLAEENLIAAARKQSGLHYFGDESFRRQLRILLHDLEHESDLNPVGRMLTRQSLVRLLRNRLLAQDLLDRHPEILERKFAPPVVVVGLGRSGTTRLHRLLAADSRFLHLKAWESVFPVPWPESFGSDKDPRITSIEQGLKAVLYMSPQIAAVHPLGAHEVEEEVGLIQHGFSSQLFEILTRTPNLAEWLMTHDQTAAYEYMVVLLKIIGWFRGDPEDKPWVLKTPQHMQDLDALMKVFPDARLVFTHRDPVKVVGSLCSMTWNSIVRDTDHVDPHWVGREWLGKTERMVRKVMDLRDRIIPAAQQHDALYADISTDWVGVMDGIYGYLGMPFTDEARHGMEQWLAINRQHKHGAHKYALEDFGLTREQVDERLMFYRLHYQIPYETRARHE